MNYMNKNCFSQKILFLKNYQFVVQSNKRIDECRLVGRTTKVIKKEKIVLHGDDNII